MHLPMLHISSRYMDDTLDEDPLRLGTHEGRDLIPWLADRDRAIIRATQRTPFLDFASLTLAAVGSEVTYFAILSGLFSIYNRQKALSLAGVILPSVAINQIAKSRFRFPRPPVEAQHPWAFVAPGDFTFPSGHAQNAVALGMFLANRSRRMWVKAVGLTLATTIPLSRVYLGVHYPRDVMAGALLGVGALASVNVLEQPFRDWWENAPRGSRGFALAFSCSIAGLLTGTPLAAFPLGVAGGLAAGHDVSGQHRFRLDQPSKRQRFAQGAIGVGLTMATGLAIRPLLKRESSAAATLAGTLVGVALTLGVPLTTGLVKRLVYMKRKKKAAKQAKLRRQSAGKISRD